MYLFCPRCNTQHLASSRCPRCSSRLLAPAEATDVLVARTPPTPPATQPGFLGRVVVGSLIALGLHLAFREWVHALLAVGGTVESGFGLWGEYALRVIGGLVGGAVAGTGRPRSFQTGAVVGGFTAVAWLTVDGFPEATIGMPQLIAAGVLAGGSSLAAVVGGWVWPPPVEVKPPEASHNSSLLRLKPTESRPSHRPIAWVRILITATVAMSGVLTADVVRRGMASLPDGLFNNLLSQSRTDALIAGFVAVVAGVLAGASTGSGGRHGALCGFLASVGVVGVSASVPDGLPHAVQYVVDLCGCGEAPQQGLLLAGVILFGLVTVSGWFGGQLVPVVRKRVRLTD